MLVRALLIPENLDCSGYVSGTRGGLVEGGGRSRRFLGLVVTGRHASRSFSGSRPLLGSSRTRSSNLVQTFLLKSRSLFSTVRGTENAAALRWTFNLLAQLSLVSVLFLPRNFQEFLDRPGLNTCVPAVVHDTHMPILDFPAIRGF